MKAFWRIRALLCALILTAGSTAWGSANYTGYSGAPGTHGSCASSCHGSAGGTISVTGFPSSYVSGQAYTIGVKHTGGSSIRNFNASVRVGSGSGTAGTITAGLNTSTYNVASEPNGVHFTSSSRDSGRFVWTAPDPGVGDVKLYLAGLQGGMSGTNTSIVLTATQQPAYTHDVGVRSITAPGATIDSTASLTPACSVYNYGQSAEDYRIRLKIGSFYEDTVRVTGHAAGAALLVSFSSRTNWPRGQYPVSCSTELVGDEQPVDDKEVSTTLVLVHDLSILPLGLPDSINLGSIVTPTAWVRNLGNQAEVFNVRFRIPTGTPPYDDSQRVASHLVPGDSIEIRFAAWSASPAGDQIATCSHALVSDMIGGNDTVSDSFRVAVWTGIASGGEFHPLGFSLEVPSPNPFVAQTTLSYVLIRTTPVELAVYTSDGRRVRQLANLRQRSGFHEAVWNGMDDSGRRASPGLYYCRLRAGGVSVTRSLLKLD